MMNINFTGPQRRLMSESEGVIFTKVGDEYQTAIFNKMLDPESEEARGYYKDYSRRFKPGYWVSPSGSKLYRADPQGHGVVAATILKNEYGQKFNYYTSSLDDRDDLYARGWVRVRGNRLDAEQAKSVISAIVRLLKKGFYKENTEIEVVVGDQALQGLASEVITRLSDLAAG